MGSESISLRRGDELAASPGGELSIGGAGGLAIRNDGLAIRVTPRQVVIGGKKRTVHPEQLMRLIRRVTQNIGEYRTYDDVYSALIIPSLRKARSDLASVLYDQFHIHFKVDPNGESVFYM